MTKERASRMKWADDDDLEISQCMTCKHNQGEGKCLAFLNGIPIAILENKHDHRLYFYAGDNGIRYEKIEE